jgi:DNA primase large subunit
MTTEEKEQHYRAIMTFSGHDCVTEDFIVVPFTAVPDLVSKAWVFLSGGLAFLPKSEAFSAILNLFREQLEAVMEQTMLELPNIPDERVFPLLQSIRDAHQSIALSSLQNSNSASPNGSFEVIGAGDIESVSTHFPPCMVNIYDALKQERHLKYHGRQQLSLFLKTINLPLSEALMFWRRSFKVSDDAFNKEYAYNVRHNYGQEGKRANYGCPPCNKMISTVPPNTNNIQEAHGCPLRYFYKKDDVKDDGTRLISWLVNKFHLNENDASNVFEQVKGGHYQIACTKSLEAKSGQPNLETITMPTQFYEISLKNHISATNGR